MAAVALLLASAPLVPAQPAGAAQPATANPSAAPAGAGARIDLRVEPAVALWAGARALAETSVEPKGPLGPLVEALRALGGALPSARGWGRFDSALLGVHGAGEIAARLSGISSLRLRGGGELDIAAEVERLTAALIEVEPAFVRELWPSRLAAIGSARTAIEERLLPRQSEAFDAMLGALGMSDPGRPIPIYLVPTAVWPGAATYRDRDGTGYCVVAVDRPEAQGSALLEIVLHEATHALDVAAGQAADASVLARLRQHLRDAGLAATDDALRDLPHTVMFVQAGETIRRIVDPQHVHYGDGPSGYYDRVPHARLVRDLWIAHLDGELPLDEVLSRLVAAATGVEGGGGNG